MPTPRDARVLPGRVAQAVQDVLVQAEDVPVQPVRAAATGPLRNRWISVSSSRARADPAEDDPAAGGAEIDRGAG